MAVRYSLLIPADGQSSSRRRTAGGFASGTDDPDVLLAAIDGARRG
jgi:hypothetical protein